MVHMAQYPWDFTQEPKTEMKKVYNKCSNLQLHALLKISVFRIIHKILEDGDESNSGDSPQRPSAIIIAPTRELAVQIKDEARKFSNESMCKAVVMYGGTSTGFQLQTLFRGTNILIA